MFVANGLIRKISINDPKTGLTYLVGQKMMSGTLTITEIRLDVDGSIERGYAKYDILVRKNDSNHSRIWKSIENMPVAIEYEIDEVRYVEN